MTDRSRNLLDLLDDIAELTLNKGGSVTVLPYSRMPHQNIIAAVLRWSDIPAPMVAGGAGSYDLPRLLA